MQVVQTIELSEEECKIVRDFIDIIDKISDIIPNKSMEDIASYFCDNAEWGNGTWNIDRIHQIKEM